MKNPPKTYVAHINYDVAIKNGWMPDVLKLEMEDDKHNPETRQYLFIFVQ